MITVKLKTNLIDKNRIHRGKKHNYLDLVLIENRNGRDEYGFDGYIKQKLTAEELDSDPRPELPIIGNWTKIERRPAADRPSDTPPRGARPAPRQEMAEDDIPF
jgi:Na+-transporting NADH:ubiquinone oxidoreductase subunit NqrA